MSDKLKILYVTQEVSPYCSPTTMAETCKTLAKNFQEHGAEIRMFMPLYGTISQRRHQLHEVIRLSGMNLIIDDSDYPLIIKVGTMPQAKFQVYFIDNEEYFSRESNLSENGKEHPDNANRSIFYCRGVIETVKKLCWTPDIIHCNGWLTHLLPFMTNKSMREFPFFEDAKIILSLYNKGFNQTWNTSIQSNLLIDDMAEEHVKVYDKPDYTQVTQIAIDNSDGVMAADSHIDKNLLQYAKEQKGKLFANIPYDQLNYEQVFNFYQKVLGK